MICPTYKLVALPLDLFLTSIHQLLLHTIRILSSSWPAILPLVKYHFILYLIIDLVSSQLAMSSTQTVSSTSIFRSPFHDPSSNPDAFGSYTSCQGPSPKPQTSPVAKFRKHIASTFAPRPTHSIDFLTLEPFDPDIVSLPFVPEDKSASAGACSVPPSGHHSSNTPASSTNVEPFGAFGTNIIMPSVSDDVHEQHMSSRNLRRLSSRATLADIDRSASATYFPDGDFSTRTQTSINRRPTTAAGAGGCRTYHAGLSGTKDCRCPYSYAEYRFANMKLCKCACSSKNCRCKSNKLPNKILRILEHHGLTRRRSNDRNTESRRGAMS